MVNIFKRRTLHCVFYDTLLICYKAMCFVVVNSIIVLNTFSIFKFVSQWTCMVICYRSWVLEIRNAAGSSTHNTMMPVETWPLVVYGHPSYHYTWGLVFLFFFIERKCHLNYELSSNLYPSVALSLSLPPSSTPSSLLCSPYVATEAR